MVANSWHAFLKFDQGIIQVLEVHFSFFFFLEFSLFILHIQTRFLSAAPRSPPGALSRFELSRHASQEVTSEQVLQRLADTLQIAPCVLHSISTLTQVGFWTQPMQDSVICQRKGCRDPLPICSRWPGVPLLLISVMSSLLLEDSPVLCLRWQTLQRRCFFVFFLSTATTLFRYSETDLTLKVRSVIPKLHDFSDRMIFWDWTKQHVVRY